jgi:hypothetical protein
MMENNDYKFNANNAEVNGCCEFVMDGADNVIRETSVGNYPVQLSKK